MLSKQGYATALSLIKQTSSSDLLKTGAISSNWSSNSINDMKLPLLKHTKNNAHIDSEIISTAFYLIFISEL